MTLAFDANMDLTVEFGFGDGPLEATIAWTDVTAYVRAGSWDRGRGSLDSDFPAGSGELVLDNTTGRFYPWNTSGPYTPNVVPGVPVTDHRRCSFSSCRVFRVCPILVERLPGRHGKNSSPFRSWNGSAGCSRKTSPTLPRVFNGPTCASMISWMMRGGLPLLGTWIMVPGSSPRQWWKVPYLMRYGM